MEAEIDFRMVLVIANPLDYSFYSCELILEKVLGSWLSFNSKMEKIFSFGGLHKLLQLQRQRLADVEHSLLSAFSLPNYTFVLAQ
jgi:hypothetical protein